MNISITLNEEQTNALKDLVDAFNTNKPSPVSSTEYLQTILIGIINDKVKSNFKKSADSLVSGAESLSYSDRLELIALVQSKLK